MELQVKRVIPNQLNPVQEAVFAKYGFVYHLTSTKDYMSLGTLVENSIEYNKQYAENRDITDITMEVKDAVPYLIACGLLVSRIEI